ncbi:MEDS domain-containing protein [Niallia nealsonii]|uniref:MEDS domain-containing protein n=1 Tax=Niallia nealsonii TaxID=115979 RepID=UPI0012FE95E7|nr:MEDS domain-containing protein [Niallia nealsonii]
MDNTLLLNLLNKYKDTEGHIFYQFKNIDNYLQNVVTFITTGVKSGSHIILIENDRNFVRINKILKRELSQGEIAKIHFINNYDFYFKNRGFEPQRIFAHYKQNILPQLENNVPVWTWGLVEWGDNNEIIQQIEEYEKKVDRFVNEKGLISVCAYDVNRTPHSLKEILIRCHSVMLTDDTIVFPTKVTD